MAFGGSLPQINLGVQVLIPPPNSTGDVLECGGIVTGNGGTIVSPGYPQYFSKDIECVWLIRVDHDKHIYTRVLELQLYGSIANCNDVELSIYDGYSSFSFNPEIIKKYCGDLKYYKNVEERTQMSKRNRLLVSCQVIYSQFGLAIHQNDHQARRRFVEWAQNEIAVVPDFHKRILFSDEAHFELNGYVNKQKCRIWSEANPQVYVETPLHPEKLTVWCALWAGGILLQKR
ncbi:CUB domain-containing protein [Trichonephila clavipes]|nr:CUB domain-containing protein [Trichonephila clavipes]